MHAGQVSPVGFTIYRIFLMKKHLLLPQRLVLLFFCLLTGLASAQEEKGLLYKVSREDLPAPSYLFGTIHLICADDAPITDALRAAIASSEALVLEVDISDPMLGQEMMKSAINPGMKNIADELSEEDKELIDSFLTENYGMGLAQMGMLKPFVLMSMVIPKYLDCTVTAMDKEVMGLAIADTLPIIGLEEAAFQMSLFDSLDHEEVMGLMVDAFRNIEEDKEEFAAMLENYLAGDLAALYQYVVEEESMQLLKESLLDKRNQNWIPLLEATMQEQPVTVAVGAGHLAGEQGLITLLRGQGYTVEVVQD